MEVQFLKQAELAERWRITQRTLERWRWQGIGPAYTKIGTRVVYRMDDIETFEMKARHATASCGPFHPSVLRCDDGAGQ